MRLWSLFIVAWMPVLQVLLIGLLGAFLASDYCNILKPDARKNTNKVVYCVCVPALVFSSLASTVTLKDIVSWWFMPVNIGITFLIGATLGWLAVKIIRPGEHFRGLVVACSSAGNWGTLPLMIVPAICNEEDSPFGDAGTCNSLGRSYVSFSMALGNFYIWTYSYHIMKKCAIEHYKNCKNCGPSNISDNEIFGQEAKDSYGVFLPLSSNSNDKDEASYSNSSFSPSTDFKGNMINYLRRTKEKMREMLEEFWSPPTIAAFIGFTVGAIHKLKSLIAVEDAPLGVVQDSAKLLGEATMPCTILILGRNLSKGIGKMGIKPSVVVAIIMIRFMILPVCGIGIVRAAGKLGFLPHSPLYQYVQLLQFTVPPAMGIGTIAQLFDVGEEDCSIIFLWTHLVAALALTLWSAVFMQILS